MNKNYKSQINQDKIVDFALSRKRNGVFLDIGAHDGITFSNTYFFEKKRNWKGICIEPNPDVFLQLINNRQCKCINCAIAQNDSVLTYRKIKGHYLVEMLGGILEFMDDKHIERINREISELGGTIEDIPVKCKNINSILNESRIFNINYLSIDTEGAEFKILSTIDFKRVNIKVLSVENNYANEVRQLLEGNGYQGIAYDFDVFYFKDKMIGYRILFITYCLRIKNFLKRKFNKLLIKKNAT